MLSTAQLQKIWLLSDTVLYGEAVSFIRNIVNEPNSNPLPTSQVAGLLSIAEATRYDDLYLFVVHQRDRNWPSGKRDIKTFYTRLEALLVNIQEKRLKNEFHLMPDVTGRSISEARQEVKEVMALLAREFIQHVAAENGVLAAQRADERMKQKVYRR